VPCYVDRLTPGQVRGVRAREWCHLIADTLDELHTMARRIGMKRTWFQSAPPASHPHYDLVESRRKHAVELGAIELDRARFVEKLRQIRSASPAPREAK
jgi:hypothetical protein